MKFNGDEEWSAYYTHFRAVANHNGWDAEEQAENLAISLQGPALELFAELSQRRQTKLSSVVRAMRNRFEPEGREAKYRADFHGRDRQGESPEDYARLLAKLARRAFPGIPAESREDLLLERYVRGQTSPSLKEVMSIAYPRTMEEAITSVYKHEAQQRENRSHRRTEMSRAVSEEVVSKEPAAEISDTAKLTLVLNGLAKMMMDVQKAAKETAAEPIPKREETRGVSNRTTPSGGGRSFDPRRPRVQREHVRCYNCDEYGHYATECQKERRSIRDRPPTPPPLGGVDEPVKDKTTEN